MSIKLLVGLGNPGPEYQATRHNAGFWLVERYAGNCGARFRNERAFFGLVAKAGPAWLLLPQTYMNRSGQSVGALARFYKIATGEILVAHDELDLLPGSVKLKQAGGHAGHNGLKDIAATLGTPDFWRLRIGIGHPRSLNLKHEVVDFVLNPPRRDEAEMIDKAIDRCLAVLPDLFNGNIDKATMQLHTKG